MTTPLLIGPDERAALAALVKRAELNPVDMRTLSQRLEDPAQKAAHMDAMTAQTVAIPAAYLVTFSIEHGHPGGPARHMSISVDREGRVPSPVGVWMVAQELGFVGALEKCAVWSEDLQGHGKAVNVVQFLETLQ